MIRASLIAASVVIIAACADTPSKVATNDTPIPVAHPVPAAAPAATTPSDTAQAKLQDDAESAGYRVKVRAGHKLYCRVVTPMGSHIPESECLTEAALQKRLDADAESRDSWARSRQCGNMSCNGGAPQGH